MYSRTEKTRYFWDSISFLPFVCLWSGCIPVNVCISAIFKFFEKYPCIWILYSSWKCFRTTNRHMWIEEYGIVGIIGHPGTRAIPQKLFSIFFPFRIVLMSGSIVLHQNGWRSLTIHRISMISDPHSSLESISMKMCWKTNMASEKREVEWYE